MTDYVTFIPGISSNFMPCVEIEITCVPPLKTALVILIVCRMLDLVKGSMITFSTMSLSECGETKHSIQPYFACFFFVFLFFILFSVFFLSSKICYFHFRSALNEKPRNFTTRNNNRCNWANNTFYEALTIR